MRSAKNFGWLMLTLAATLSHLHARVHEMQAPENSSLILFLGGAAVAAFWYTRSTGASKRPLGSVLKGIWSRVKGNKP